MKHDTHLAPWLARINRQETVERILGMVGVAFLIGLMGTATTCITVTFYGHP